MLAGLCKRFGVEVPELDPLWLDDMFEIAEIESKNGRNHH